MVIMVMVITSRNVYLVLIILAPRPGIELVAPALKGEVLTTGLPGRSPGKNLNHRRPLWRLEEGIKLSESLFLHL